MSRTLLIAKKEMTNVDVYFLQDDHISSYLNVVLSEAKMLVGDTDVCFLFPTEWVSFVDIVLPQIKPSLLKAVVPNMIEEYIVEPIENVHWALAADYQGEKTTVAVMNRAHIENTINMCKTAGIDIETLCPDIYLIPMPENTWEMWNVEDRVCVRQDKWHGFVLAASESDAWFKAIRHPVRVAEFTDAWVKNFLQSPVPINLLQGEFVIKPKRSNINLLKKSLYALAGSVAFYFAYLIVSGVILSHRLNVLQEETLALYQQAIPGATHATSPRVVLTRELQKRGQSNHRFFVLLSALGDALSKSPGIQLTSIQFSENHLSATVQTKDFSTLDAWTANLSHQSISFKQESAEQTDDHVTARIQLEEK